MKLMRRRLKGIIKCFLPSLQPSSNKRCNSVTSQVGFCSVIRIVSPCIVLKGKVNMHFISLSGTSSLSLLTIQRVCYKQLAGIY